MTHKIIKPGGCFTFGMQLSRALTDSYYRKHGHIKIRELTLHHYLLLLAVPLCEDECMQAFIAGAALDDLPDLLDDLFPESNFV